ncbi:MAG: transcriptional regulator [Methylocella sp.]
MTPIQCKMARVALGLGVRELAAAAKVAPGTVTRFEGGEELKERTVDAMRRALEAAGLEFIAENGGGAGVRLKRRGGKRTGDVCTVEDLNSESDED